MGIFLIFLKSLFLLLIVSGVFMTLGCSETEAQKKTDHQSAPSYDYKGKLPALATSGGVYVLDFPKSIELNVFRRRKIGVPTLDKVFPGKNKNLSPIGTDAGFSKKLSEYSRYQVSLYSDEVYSIPFVQEIQLYYMRLWDKISPSELIKLACPEPLKGKFCNISPKMEEKYGSKWGYWIMDMNPLERIDPYDFFQSIKKAGFYFSPRLKAENTVSLNSIVGRCTGNDQKWKNYHCLFMGYVGKDKHLVFRFDVVFPKKHITRDQLYRKLYGELTKLEKLLSMAVVRQF